MSVGIKFNEIKIVDDLIIDGHHRFLAALLANTKLETIPSSKTSATIVYDWNNIVFDVNDWDTEAKILMLNEQDADNNNITLKEIIELLK
jgi:ParB-like chromosome segregation protein Spo0J